MAQHASRRTLLIGTASAFALGGCAVYDQRGPAADPHDAPALDASGAGANGPAASGGAAPSPATPSAGGPPADAPPAGKLLASTVDIPVGGGKVFGDQGVVVTQPQAGTFKAFTAVCTHAGCTVAEVRGGTINCSCHGSKFKAADGSVAQGPAARPLKTIALRVTGSSIFLAS